MTTKEDRVETVIVKLGTLYFIPLDRPIGRGELDGIDNFFDAKVVNRGQPRLIIASSEDRCHTGLYCAVVIIPDQYNGETRSIDDIHNELRRLLKDMSVNGLVPKTTSPKVIHR